MKSVHISRPRNFRGVDTPNYNGTRGNESRFVRCKFCGSINDTELRSNGATFKGNLSIITDTPMTLTVEL